MGRVSSHIPLKLSRARQTLDVAILHVNPASTQPHSESWPLHSASPLRPAPPTPAVPSFLISGVIILVLGMVFTSRGFTPGTLPYQLFTAVAALFIFGTSFVFAGLLVFEVRAPRA